MNLRSAVLMETYHHVEHWRGGEWVPNSNGILCNRGGKLIHVEETHNKVVTAGLNKLIDATFKTGLTTPAWYLGLVGQSISDAIITSGLSALTSASALWAAGDVGSPIIVAGAGAPSNGFPTDLITTIATFVSAGSVTTTAPAGANAPGNAALWGPRAADTMASHSPWSLVTAYSNATLPAFVPGAVANGSVDNTGSPAIFNINAINTRVGGLLLTDSNTSGGSTGTLYGMATFASGFRGLTTGDSLAVSSTISAAAQ